jgi:sulfur carrier protein
LGSFRSAIELHPRAKILLDFRIESKVISLTVNGQERQLPDTSRISQLLDEMQLTNKRLAVEKNGEIVPRSRFSEEMLRPGDVLEIVVAVGGG